MTTALEAIRARNAKTEQVADAFGRLFRIKRLNGAERVRLGEFTDSTNNEVATRIFLACSLLQVDGVPVPFPKNRAELDSILTMLDEEGLLALAEGYKKLNDNMTQDDKADLAKKSQGTPNSD